MTGYLIGIGRLAQPTARLIGTVCLAIFAVLIPLNGMLSDRIGRQPLLLASCIGVAVLGYRSSCWDRPAARSSPSS